MALVTRIINASFTLATGNFGSGGNSLNLTGLRCSVKIQNALGQSQGELDMAIYGMSLSHMNQLSTLGTNFTSRQKNQIQVSAGDSASGVQMIYQGIIDTAYLDGQAMPEVAFRIHALEIAHDAVKPQTPISFNGPTKVAGTIMPKLAQLLGFPFENSLKNDITLMSPYLWGDVHQMVLHVAKAAGILHSYDRGTLSIWAPETGRTGAGGNILISPQTGMVGYPMSGGQSSMIVKALLNTAVKPGSVVQVQSDLSGANGSWDVNKIVLELESVTPRGKWFMTLTMTPNGNKNVATN